MAASASSWKKLFFWNKTFIMDGETKISKVVENAAKEHGSSVELVAYVRYQLGEGIEKEETDFAAEVAKAANG